MKRTAFDAGLPWDLSSYIGRMDVCVRDHMTQNELHHFHLQLCSCDNIDTAKYMLSMRICERIGKFPRLSSFQLEQYGIHLRFTDSVTSVQTTLPCTHNISVLFPKRSRTFTTLAEASQTSAFSSKFCTRPRQGALCVCVRTSLVHEIRGSQPNCRRLDRTASFAYMHQFSLQGSGACCWSTGR